MPFTLATETFEHKVPIAPIQEDPLLAKAKTLLTEGLFGSEPLSQAFAVSIRKSLGSELLRLSKRLAKLIQTAPTTLFEMASFPELAEAKIALERGLQWQKEEKASNGLYYCFNRKGASQSNTIGVFRPQKEEHRPNQFRRTETRYKPWEFLPYHKDFLRLTQDRAKWKNLLKKAAFEERWHHAGNRWGQASTNQAALFRICRNFQAFPQTVQAQLQGKSGSFQIYIPNLRPISSLKERLWETELCNGLRPNPVKLRMPSCVNSVTDSWDRPWPGFVI